MIVKLIFSDKDATYFLAIKHYIYIFFQLMENELIGFLLKEQGF